MKCIVVIVYMLLLTACNGSEKAHQPNQIPKSGAYIVDMDVGGDTDAYARRFDQLNERGTKVIIKSHATSAAVIFAYLPNACLEPSALLRFHGPETNGKLDPRAVHWISDRLLPGARKQYDTVWSKIPHTAPMFDLKREAAISLDPKLKRCEEVQ